MDSRYFFCAHKQSQNTTETGDVLAHQTVCGGLWRATRTRNTKYFESANAKYRQSQKPYESAYTHKQGISVVPLQYV